VALLIAIEGIDGSGKGTQAALLHERLLRNQGRAHLLSFPRYEATFFGRAVGRFLNGEFGSLHDVHPFLAALLFAGDRFESRQLVLEAAQENEILIFDRYVSSNVAHQAAKLQGRLRAELIQAVEELEYGIYQLPRPDLVILLDLPADQAQRHVALKAARSYTDKAADLHEADAGYLNAVREVYLQQALAAQNWQTIDCTQGGTMRSIEDIGDEIWRTVMSHWKRNE
jgi:dTMP kinase